MKEKGRWHSKEWLEKKLIQYGTVTKLLEGENIPKSGCSVRKYIRLFGLRGLVQHPAQNRIHFFNDRFFEDIQEEKQAYWLGMIMSDGAMDEYHTGSCRIQLLLKDVDHINKFIQDIGSNKTVYIDPEGRGSIKFYSKRMFNDLVALGKQPSNKSATKFPELADNLIRHFVRGFFDGDGSVFSRNQTGGRKRSLGVINIVLPNLEFCNVMISQIEQATGYHLNYYHKIKSDVYEIKSESIVFFQRFVHWIYDNSTVYLQRKYDRAMSILNLLPCLGRNPRLQIG